MIVVRYMLLWMVIALLCLVSLAGCRSDTQSQSSESAGQEIGGRAMPDLKKTTLADPQSSGSILLPSFSEGRISSNVYPNQQFGIWVTGAGSVLIEPDMAVLSISIEAQEDSVSLAQSRVNQAMSVVLEQLQRSRIANKDLQTSHFRIQPNYIYEPVEIKGEPQYHLPQRQILIGYVLDQGLTIKVRFLDRLGDLIDNITNVAGNIIQVDSIRFDIDDRNAQQVSARTLALEDATAKAQQIADVMGVTLGSVVYVADLNTSEPKREMTSMLRSYAEMDVGTSVMTGELEIQVALQVVFDIGNT